MKAKRCEICNTRPVDPQVKRESGADHCRPCDTLAGHENMHSDYDHEGINSGKVVFGQTTHKTKSSFNEWLKSTKRGMAECWVCHPELDETQEEYAQRNGTSRLGIVLSVPIRGTGKDKAAAVTERFRKPYVCATRTSKGTVIFKATAAKGGCEIRWDLVGRYLGAEVTLEGKTRKARNVSEVLRLLSL